ncbi:MAG TPA: serine/threonine-protein kinase [Ramlibacter sp.]|jgi:serine/threonine-protein kinase|nr:serine/threonine-protein kinase [Ramlibacter sp.]
MRNPPPFTHLGRYRVVRELGRGAMGVVYLAQDDTLQRQVAIKTLLLPDAPAERAHLEARFRQEAKAAGGLNHPGIITIHDLGREGDWLYIAMELLQGTELRDRMAQGPLPLDVALDIGAQVASALAAAHASGVVHRDIKPGNIMLVGNGQAKIMDFGIARMQSSDVRTQSGTMLGSPKYMSPEQVSGHPADHRSDIFSLGSVLYEMVAGVPAFGGDNLGELLSLIQHGHPPPPGTFRPGIPGSLEVVIARAMQKNPAARYQDAGEMARDLVQCRAALTRSRGAAPAAAAVDISTDVFGGATATLAIPPGGPAPGLALSPAFDSTLGLRTLLQASADPAAQAPRRHVRSVRGLLWTFAYMAAAAAALVIALA